MVNDPIIQAMAEVLLHSLWQGAVLLLLLLIVIHIFRNDTNIRYWLSTGFLLLLPFISIVTFFSFWHPVSTISHPQLMPKLAGSGYNLEINTINLSQEYSRYFISAWMLGMIAFSLYRLAGLIYLRRLQNNSPSVSGSSPIRVLQQWSAKMNLNRKIIIRQSHTIQSPFTFGAWKPVIMMPAAMLEWISTEQLEAIIVHELIHIKRQDYLINLFVSTVETIYFFNPAVWIMKKIISQEREFSCDYLANKRLQQPLKYCRTLAQIQIAGVQQIPVLNFNRKNNMLMKRIQKLFGRYQPEFPFIPMITALLVLVFFISGYQAAPGDRLILSNVDEYLTMMATSELPEVPKPSSSIIAEHKPSAAKPVARTKQPLTILTPTRTLKDDTIKIKMKENEEIQIKSKTDDKTIYLNNKEVGKDVLDQLNPDSIKSISVVEDEIFIQTKGYKYKSKMGISIRFRDDLASSSNEKKEPEPLFVLDGEIVSDNILKELDPDEIDSIEVLKDESAKVVYGEKGKNGVILITLKKDE